jgi:Protein of unknown function (DUF2950)
MAIFGVVATVLSYYCVWAEKYTLAEVWQRAKLRCNLRPWLRCSKEHAYDLLQATVEGRRRRDSRRLHPGVPFVPRGNGGLCAAKPSAPTGGAHRYMAKGKLMGGFALMAWPAEYGVTGIHTFIVNQDDMVYEKDLAPVAGKPGATAITRYHPDRSRQPVD